MNAAAVKAKPEEDTTRAVDPHEELVAEVRRLDGEAQRWEARAVELDAEAEEVDAGAGDAILDDPEAEQRLAGHLANLRDQARLARRASATAAERAVVARRAVARHEVGPLAAVERQALEELDEHRREADELLARLKEFTGADYRRVSLGTLQGEANEGERITYSLSVAERLQSALTKAERRRRAMEAAADGEDPRKVVSGLSWEDLGECLRTGGVLDLGILDPVVRAERDRQEVERRFAEVEGEKAELESELAGLQARLADPKVVGADVQLAEQIRETQLKLNAVLSRWHTLRAQRESVGA